MKIADLTVYLESGYKLGPNGNIRQLSCIFPMSEADACEEIPAGTLCGMLPIVDALSEAEVQNALNSRPIYVEHPETPCVDEIVTCRGALFVITSVYTKLPIAGWIVTLDNFTPAEDPCSADLFHEIGS